MDIKSRLAQASLHRQSARGLLAALAFTGCTVGGLTTALLTSPDALAQGAGLNIQWNQNPNKRARFLPFTIELSNTRNQFGRYRLRIGSEDLKLAAMQFTVGYSPKFFDGKFDPKAVEVKVCQTLGNALSNPKGCKTIDIEEVTTDLERGRISIYPKEPVPAGSNVEMSFSNVRNPRNSGLYRLDGFIETPGDVPLLRQAGSWMLEIN